MTGPHVSLVGTTHLPINQKPLLLYNGSLTVIIASGKTSSLLLETHSFLRATEKDGELPVIALLLDVCT